MGSIITSAPFATASPRKATSPSRLRSSTASNPISSAATRRRKSRSRANSSPIPTGPRCCSTRQAAIDAVKDVGPVGIVGFCLGGSVVYAAATKLSGLTAAIGFYGGAIARFADDRPKVPTQLHFGEKDAGIPLSDVEIIRGKRPEVEIHVYPGAQHGFNCEERASYDKAKRRSCAGAQRRVFRQAFEVEKGVMRGLDRAFILKPSFPGASKASEPGIQNSAWRWIPGLRLSRRIPE